MDGAIALNTDGILHGILNAPPTLKLQTTLNTYILLAGGTVFVRYTWRSQ
jgi:hypothetical protein